MPDTTTPPTSHSQTEDAFPARFATGGTFLLACAGDPVATDIDLQALCRFGSPDDTAFVVTTTKSAKTTVADFEQYCAKADRPALGLVDTTSEHQFVPSLFEGTPTIFTPSPGDLERLVLALSELTDRFPLAPAHAISSSGRSRPYSSRRPPDWLCPVLERLKGLRTQTGLCLFGIDYTAHDPTTMNAVSDVVDGILWITPTPEGIELEYQHGNASESPVRPPASETDA